jgi:WD repeat-containing protein 40A
MSSDDLQSDMIALGSRRHLTFLDPRINPATSVRCVPVPNQESGVRSISFRQHLITVGCGVRHLLFFDTRNNSWIGDPDAMLAGKGWIRRDQNYDYMFPEDHLNPSSPSQNPKHAIYAHAYNASGTVLFTGGGPLQVGLYGCYGALWQQGSNSFGFDQQWAGGGSW